MRAVKCKHFHAMPTSVTQSSPLPSQPTTGHLATAAPPTQPNPYLFHAPPPCSLPPNNCSLIRSSPACSCPCTCPHRSLRHSSPHGVNLNLGLPPIPCKLGNYELATIHVLARTPHFATAAPMVFTLTPAFLQSTAGLISSSLQRSLYCTANSSKLSIMLSPSKCGFNPRSCSLECLAL